MEKKGEAMSQSLFSKECITLNLLFIIFVTWLYNENFTQNETPLTMLMPAIICIPSMNE